MADLRSRSRATPAKDKARYNQNDGRVLRKFLGLTVEDEDTIRGWVEERIQTNIGANTLGYWQHDATPGITIDRNFGQLNQITWMTRSDWVELSSFVIMLIQTRTLQGRDEDGNAFAAYSPEYAKQRSQAGLSTSPDLSVSGEMLNALVAEIMPDGFVITVQ
jgi:hypothetical protein